MFDNPALLQDFFIFELMRLLLLLITLILYTVAHAQSIEDKLFKKMCECLTLATTQKKALDDEKFDNCVSSDSSLNKELEEYLPKDDSLRSPDGYEFGRKFFNKNQIRLIHECDGWFHFIDSARYDFLNEVDKKEQQKQIDSLTKLISINPDKSQLYQLRGLSFFSLLKLSDAQSDFDKALSLPEASVQCLYFRGWVAEINGKYDEAIKDYKMAKSLNEDSFLDTVIAIAERKKKGKK